MITCKARYRNDTNNIFLQANEYVIGQSKKVKVLGIYFTAGLTHMATINNIISKVNYRIYIPKEVFK